VRLALTVAVGQPLAERHIEQRFTACWRLVRALVLRQLFLFLPVITPKMVSALGG
jgi:hypothetical protein